MTPKVTSPVPTAVLEDKLSPKQIHLIRTTYQAISERGAHRVSLQEIADRAGVSKGVILYYFKSKDNLYLQTMGWVLSRTAERIRQAISAVRSPREQVDAMISAIFLEPEANRRFYFVYLDLLDHAARLDEFSKLNATFRAIVNSVYADVILAGTEAEAFDVDDVEEAAATVRAIVDGLFLQWLQETDWKGMHDRYRAICQHAVLTYLGVEATSV